MDILQERCNEINLKKLKELDNPLVLKTIEEVILLCNPKSIFVLTESEDDFLYVRKRALEEKEELPLKIKGHTVHFDGYFDQARDKKATKFLLPQGESLGTHINSIERNQGLKELKECMKNIMEGKEVIVGFFSLGPLNSDFSILALQITDSFYVAHSETILYRVAYQVFKDKKPKDFFRFIHSAGRLENAVSKDIEKRKIYIDLKENTVYSLNTQYAGNTLGLKKLALRLAIRKAYQEGWLAEHMFIMGVKHNVRITYFTGAFPSGCGKTSTAMLKGETIVGDDIAYLREKEGEVFAVNPEVGMFGILQDVNKDNDPLIWDALNKEEEIIFTNVLVTPNKEVRWLGDGRPLPSEGINFSGKWFPGKKDAQGKEIPYAHKNARFTIRLNVLPNCDSNLENPCGVKVSGIIYGGRDSDTWPPLIESFDWNHGVVTLGASLESEVTFATLDKEGERKFTPFSNLDFLSVTIAQYIQMYLSFGQKLKKPPKIFGVNYFLKDERGNFLSDKEDKHVWIKWMEKRIYNEIEAIKTPIGFIPRYQDLRELFKAILDKDYSYNSYLAQFTLRVDNNLKKIERITNIYRDIEGTPEELFEILDAQRCRLQEIKEKFGDFVSPDKFV